MLIKWLIQDILEKQIEQNIAMYTNDPECN